ncbi:unnamed protein product [Absidia cylindrospora]
MLVDQPIRMTRVRLYLQLLARKEKLSWLVPKRSSQKRKASLISGLTQPQEHSTPTTIFPSPIDSCHLHSTLTDGLPHQIPITSMSLPTRSSIAFTNPPYTTLTAPSTGPVPIPATLPRYERILPKRPHDTSSAVSPSSPSANIYTATSLPPDISVTYLYPSLAPPPPSTANQREHARKVSHSAIERRRRERINDRIMQLKHIIPTCADQENLHKLSILQSAIEYIHYLKNIVEEKQPRQSPPFCSHPNHPMEIPPPPTTIESRPSPGDDGPHTSSSSKEPLLPLDIVIHSPSPIPSSPPSYDADPSLSTSHPLSLGKNNHMKVDNLLS